MPRLSLFTDEEILKAVTDNKGVYSLAAKALVATGRKITKQGLRERYLTLMKKRGELPPPTEREVINKEKAKERKVRLLSRPRDPTMEDINKWALDAARALVENDQLREENNRLKNRLAVVENENKQLHAEKQKKVAEHLEFERILASKDR